MRFCRHLCIPLLFLFFGLPLTAQVPAPDYTFRQFFPPERQRVDQLPANPLKARAWIYSDGRALTVIVEVEDSDIRTSRSSTHSDHVQIWIGLDDSAFPADFPHDTHPYYLGALSSPSQARLQRGNVTASTRIFAPQAPVRSPARDWLQEFGYPDERSVINDSLYVPAPEALRSMTVPYGMVHFALYPDERPAEWLNKGDFAILSQALGTEPADWMANIRYDCDTFEHRQGYIISAEIPLEAFGFVKVPSMESIRVLLAVANASRNGSPAKIELFSQPDRQEPRLANLKLVQLQQPLRINPTNVPSEVFERAGQSPTMFHSSRGWMPVQVRTGPLVLRPSMVSRQWQEIQYSPVSIGYEDFRNKGYAVQRLTLGYDRVNMPGEEQDYLLINGSLEKSYRSKSERVTADNIAPVFLFRYPDGATGIFLRDNFPFHPYGWGVCGTCLQERMRILRVTPSGLSTVIQWKQSEGPDASFDIQGYSFPGFYLTQIDQIKNNEIIVLVLNHRSLRQTKRIKLTLSPREQSYLVEIDP